MGVPVDADIGDTVIGPKYRDDGHASLDEATSLQHRLPVNIHAIAFPHGAGLACLLPATLTVNAEAAASDSLASVSAIRSKAC